MRNGVSSVLGEDHVPDHLAQVVRGYTEAAHQTLVDRHCSRDGAARRRLRAGDSRGQQQRCDPASRQLGLAPLRGKHGFALSCCAYEAHRIQIKG